MLALLVAAFVPAWYVLAAVARPCTWQERDWNDDGRVMVGEYFYAADMGARAAECPGGSRGTEYFRLKDGMPEKTDCGRAWMGIPGEVRL